MVAQSDWASVARSIACQFASVRYRAANGFSLEVLIRFGRFARLAIGFLAEGRGGSPRRLACSRSMPVSGFGPLFSGEGLGPAG